MPDVYTEQVRFIFSNILYLDGSPLLPAEPLAGQPVGCPMLVARHVDGLVIFPCNQDL